MLKKIIGCIVIGVLAVGSFFGIFYGVKTAKLQKQLMSNSQYIEKIEKLEKELNQSESDYLKLNNDYILIFTENEENKVELERVTNLLNDKIEELQLLESSSAVDKETILTLRSEIDALTLEKTNLTLSVQDKEELIISLQADKLALQNEITRLNGLIVGYEDIKNGVHEVDFYNGEILHVVKVVSNGTSVSDVSNPVKEGFEFDGWALSSAPDIIVDIYTLPINSDVTFVAKFTKLYSVKFQSKGVIVSTKQVRNGAYVESYTLNDVDFKGWALNSVPDTIVDIETIQIVSDTIFVAVYKQYNKVEKTAQIITTDNVLKVEGLKKEDKFRVTLKRLGIKSTFSSLISNYYLVSDESSANGYSFEESSFQPSNLYELVLEKGQSKSFIHSINGVDATITFSVECNKDGEIVVDYSVSPTSSGSGFTQYNYSITNVYDDCIEIWG